MSSMSLPKLADLAKEQVIANIYKGVPSPRSPLDSHTSNQLFRTLFPFYCWHGNKFHLTISKTLNATEISLAGGPNFERVVPFVQSQNLTHLGLGDFFRLAKYHTDKRKRRDWKKYTIEREPGVMYVPEHTKAIHFYIDICAVLRDMLNETSRKTLVHLDLSPVPNGQTPTGCNEQFIDRWVSEIASLLPSLKSLNIRQRLTTSSEFEALCCRFPNLQLLDLTNTDIESLSGISQLKELRTLRIGCLKLTDDGNFEEIFDLTNLRNLSFEATWNCQCCRFGNTVDLYLESGKSLPNLEHLDLSMNIRNMNDEKVSAFVRDHPSLKSISICGTRAWQNEYPGIKVFHYNTLSGAIDALQFYLAMKNQWMVTAVMDKLHRFREPSIENAGSCLRVVNSALEEYGAIGKVRVSGYDYLSTLMEPHLLSTYPEEDKIKTLRILLANLNHDLIIPRHMRDSCDEFGVLNNRAFLQGISFLYVQRICRHVLTLMERLVGHGPICHVKVLDILKDRMDPTSEIFEGVQKEKVLVYLERERSRDWPRDVEEMLGRVVEFIQATF